MKITLILGPQASGKTTYAQSIVSCSRAYWFEKSDHGFKYPMDLSFKIDPSISFIVVDDIPDVERLKNLISWASADFIYSDIRGLDRKEISPEFIFIFQTNDAVSNFLHPMEIKRCTIVNTFELGIGSGGSVDHPSYYSDGIISVIDFIEDKNLGFHLGNTVKYICEAGSNDPKKFVKNLEKAKWYLDRKIEQIKLSNPS